MTQERCRYFDSCSAPLCPEDPESLQHGAWFPDEETCRKLPRPKWVSRQNMIAKKLTFDSGCFTHAMIKRTCKISAGTKGVDPDKGAPHDLEKTWLKNHPPLRQSEKQVAARKKTGFQPGKVDEKGLVLPGKVGVLAEKGIQVPKPA